MDKYLISCLVLLGLPTAFAPPPPHEKKLGNIRTFFYLDSATYRYMLAWQYFRYVCQGYDFSVKVHPIT
jgi:hypothetical protein